MLQIMASYKSMYRYLPLPVWYHSSAQTLLSEDFEADPPIAGTSGIPTSQSVSKLPNHPEISQFTGTVLCATKSTRNARGYNRKNQQTCHLTSENIRGCSLRENLTKEQNEKSKAKTLRLFQVYEFSYNAEESEDVSCSFCSVKCSQYGSRREWIKCQKCGKVFPRIVR